MKNDLVGENLPLQSGDLKLAATLGGFKVERLESRLWAVTGMKFLIFDDTDIKENGYDSDDEEEMTRIAVEMSMQSGDQQTSTATSSKGKQVAMPGVPRSHKGKKFRNDDSDVEEEMVRIAIEMSMQSEDNLEQNSTATLSKGKEVATTEVPQSHEGDKSSQDEDEPCLVCSSLPEFPHNRKTRRFRLFSPRNEFPELFNSGVPSTNAVCTHYLAVSYCWPLPETDSEGNVIETPRTYKVRDLDGKVRSNRALDDVLDRAVDVANSVGLKMIWIDQECLPQPSEDSPEADKRDHQLGIQAMDLVYDRAMVTAGLLDLTVSSQAQIVALRAFMTKSGGEHLSRTLILKLPLMLEFLDQISQDRWYTRAWVIQEAISAGDRLLMVFHRGPGVTYPSRMRFGGGNPRLTSYPGHSLDTKDRALPSENIIFLISDFWRLVQRAKALLQQASFLTLDNQLSQHGRRLATDVVKKAETLHLVVFKPTHLAYSLKIQTGDSFGNRTVVDAAGALTLLKTRKCRYDDDRITIMANMCGYEYRLDPKAVAAHCDSLRVALLTLAVLNGDLSLLAPEMYKPEDSTETDGPAIINSQSSGGLPQWLYPLDTTPGFINDVTVQGFNVPGVLRPGVIEPSGLSFPAYIWDVSMDDMIDLTPVKVRWKDEWAGLNCLAIVVERREKEEQEAFEARRKAVALHLAREDTSHLARLELMERRSISGDDDDSDDSLVWRDLPDRRGVRVERRLVADWVEQQPERQASFCRIFFGILRFLMNQATEDPRSQALADSIWQSVRVDEVHEKHPALPDSVTKALFDHAAVVATPFRTLVLDRDQKGSYHQAWLMDRVMRHGHLWIGQYVPAPVLGSGEETETVAAGAAAGPSSSPSSSRGGEQDQSLDIGGPSAMVDEKARPRTILDRQLMERFFGDFVRICAFKRYAENTREEREALNREHLLLGESIGLYVSFGRFVHRNQCTGAFEDDGLHRRTSVFDVDGPCTVAVPYVSGWEILPHPRPRSMSVCWVVQRVDDREQCENQGLKRKRRDSGGTTAADINTRAEERRRYKVLGKVKGMWEVMDTPFKLYLFQ